MKYEITKNEAFKSFEIKFDEKPSEAVRDALKTLKFRWHGVKKVWYGFSDAETIAKAIDNATEGKKATAKAPKTEKVNKFGVKVGDIFTASWGYDQTNVDFFQVVALCGESSVRVREVNPKVVNEDAQCPMSAYYTYEITNEILPSASSVFIKDKEKGDIKRLNGKEGETPYFKLDSYAWARKIETGLYRAYVSWYA